MKAVAQMSALEIIGLGALGIMGWRALRSLSHQLGELQKGQQIMSTAFEQMKSTIGEIKTFAENAAADIARIQAKLENGIGLTRDEATEISNELGTLRDRMAAVAALEPEPEDEEPVEEPPVEEPPVDDPPAEPTE